MNIPGGNRRLSITERLRLPPGDCAALPSGAGSGNLFRISGELVRAVAEGRAALLKVRSLLKGTPVSADVLFTSGGGLTYLPENSGIPVQPHSCRVRNAPRTKSREPSGGIIPYGAAFWGKT